MNTVEKMKMFPGCGFKLAESFGFEMPKSSMVDISDEKKQAAYEMAEVKTITKVFDGEEITMNFLFDGKNAPIAVWSPQFPQERDMDPVDTLQQFA